MPVFLEIIFPYSAPNPLRCTSARVGPSIARFLKIFPNLVVLFESQEVSDEQDL
jgi:hypothetical protein